MIVADASVVLELLLAGGEADGMADLLLGEEAVAAPHLLDLEVAQVLRRWSLRGALDHERAAQALDDLLALPIARQPHDLVVERVWELRENLTAYDAAYLALAELLDARLVTLDRGLAAVARRTVQVVVPAADQ